MFVFGSRFGVKGVTRLDCIPYAPDDPRHCNTIIKLKINHVSTVVGAQSSSPTEERCDRL